MHPRFRAAEEALRAASETTASLCAPLRDAFGADDAGIITFGPPFGARMVCAAGPSAAAFGELQLDIGQGPAWDAFATGRPVLVHHLVIGERWPMLAERMEGVPIESVYAFPLRAGALDVGSLCLSFASSWKLSDKQLAAVAALIPLIGAAVFARAMHIPAVDDEFSLREVHRATGMVAVQLDVNPDEALLAIRAHAFATDRSVRGVAEDLLARRLDLSRD